MTNTFIQVLTLTLLAVLLALTERCINKKKANVSILLIFDAHKRLLIIIIVFVVILITMCLFNLPLQYATAIS